MLSHVQGGFWVEDEREVRLGQRAAAELPYELIETRGDRALELWRTLKLQDKGTPVVLGGYGDIYRIRMRLIGRKQGETPEERVEAASRIRFPEDLLAMRLARRAERRAWLAGEQAEGRYLDIAPDRPWPPRGPWPKKPYEEPPLCVATQWDFGDLRTRRKGAQPRRLPLEKVYVALLPCADAAEAPAHLDWGSWNDVPSSQMLVAALGSWRDRYGAELAGISHDTWSLRVEQRPTSRQEALALAAEMLELCQDLLGEVQTLEGQAALLMANAWWNFWWD